MATTARRAIGSSILIAALQVGTTASALAAPIDRYPQPVRSAPRPVAALLRDAADRHGVPVALLKAVVRVESSFNERAVSRCGAMGLMQLMPVTARELGVVDPFDPAQNIDGGARYLKRLKARFGEWKLAVAAYNAGPGRVLRHNRLSPIAETLEYVRKVAEHYRSYGGSEALF